MSHTVYEIMYRSEKKKGVDQSKISDLLLKSILKNAEHNITGCLLLASDRFFQILEGEEDIVKQLYQTIKADDRHQNVQLLSTDIHQTRSFDSWGMAYTENLPQDLIDLINTDSFNSNDVNQLRNYTIRVIND